MKEKIKEILKRFERKINNEDNCIADIHRLINTYTDELLEAMSGSCGVKPAEDKKFIKVKGKECCEARLDEFKKIEKAEAVLGEQINLKKEATGLLKEVIYDATGDINNTQKRLWAIRAKLYRKIKQFLMSQEA